MTYPFGHSSSSVFNSTVFNTNFDTIGGNSNVINGNNNSITGNSHVINGDNNFIVGNSCVVNGDNNCVKGDSNIVTGRSNKVTGVACVVKGVGSTWNGNTVSDRPSNRQNNVVSNEVFNQFFGVPLTTSVNFGNLVTQTTNPNGTTTWGFSGANHGVRTVNNNNQGGAVFHGNVTFTEDVTPARDRDRDSNRNRNRDRDPPPQPAVTEYPDAWEQEPEEGREKRDKCVICLTREVCVIALPCGHISTCVKCCRESRPLQGQADCAVCRKKVTKYQRTFINGAD